MDSLPHHLSHAGPKNTKHYYIMSTTQAEGGTQFQSTQDEGNFKKKILRMNDIKYSSKKTKTVKKSTPKSKHNALRKQGVYFDPVNADPLSSRLVHRFMFAEFLGSLFSNLISQGSVISCGALTYQFNYDELTPGRILCIAFASSFVSFISKKSPFHPPPPPPPPLPLLTTILAHPLSFSFFLFLPFTNATGPSRSSIHFATVCSFWRPCL